MSRLVPATGAAAGKTRMFKLRGKHDLFAVIDQRPGAVDLESADGPRLSARAAQCDIDVT